MKSNELSCQYFDVDFQTNKHLQTHQSKFCINSKYGDVQALQKEFQNVSQGRDISIYGKMSIDNPSLIHHLQPDQNTNRYDQEYAFLVKQINQNQTLKHKLQREKQDAYNQLTALDKIQNQTLIQHKRSDLQDIIRRRNQLAKEEEQIEKQLKMFKNNQDFDNNKSRVKKIDEDFVYREGREAGKLAMQRRLLEEKKREIEIQLKKKKRQEEKINEELTSSRLNQPIFIPDYKKIQKKKIEPIDATKKMQTEPSFIPQSFTNNTDVKAFNRRAQSIIVQQEILKSSKMENKMEPKQSLKRSQDMSVKSVEQYQQEQQKDEPPYIKPQMFVGMQKTLFEGINPLGKSDEDIFIQSLVAQEYDDLNILSKIPKNSELYQVKLKQYQQMSKIRQELRDKVQKKRLQKVRKEFEFEKQMTETEKQNIIWLDKNRRHMLNKEAEILQRHHELMEEKKEREKLESKESRQNYNQQKNYQSNYNNPYVMSNQNRQISNTGHIHENQGFKFDGEGSANNLHSQNEVPPNRSMQSLWGYKIVVRSLKNYERGRPIKMKIILKEDFIPEHNQKGMLFEFQTNYHDQKAPKTGKDPYNPNFRNRLDSEGTILFNEVFTINQNLQALYNQNQKQLFLFLIAMEKDQHKMSNQPNAYAWYCFKVSHFGQVREGVYTFNLYGDQFPYPKSADMNKQKNRFAEEVQIQIGEIVLENVQKKITTLPKKQSNKQINNPSQMSIQNHIEKGIRNGTSQQTPNVTKKRNNKTKKVLPIKNSNRQIENSIKSIDEEYFFANQNPPEFQPVTNKSQISFSFSVSWLRTLPSYTGPVKLEINFLDSDGQRLVPKEEVLSELGKDMYNPLINYSKVLSSKQMSSSCMVLIRLMSISTVDYSTSFLGFCALNLFYNSEGYAITQDIKSEDEYYLLNDYFQIPIYWANIPVQYQHPEQVYKNYPTIPCASMLIGIKFMQDQAENITMPLYSEHLYNTSYFPVEELELQLFSEQHKREKLNAKQYTQGYYLFKGINKKYNEEELKKFLSQSLAFNNENVANLDRLNHMAEYSPSFGVQVIIDGITFNTSQPNKAQTQYYYICTVCLSPPAAYYTKQTKSDLEIIYKLEASTSNGSNINFLPSQNKLSYSIPYNEKTCLIIELHRVELYQSSSSNYSITNEEVETIGHCVIELFDLYDAKSSVNVVQGDIAFQKGPFVVAELKEMNNNLERYLAEKTQNHEKLEIDMKIRVMNGFFPRQFSRLADQEDNNSSYKALSKNKFYKNMFNNTKGFQQAERQIQKIIEDHFAVTL